jgi:hypothetical protein
MILFMDFDGVLHPDAVFLGRSGPVLRSDGQLFMWAGLLEAELAPFPDVRIVLSTSWVRQLGFARAKTQLPASLEARIVGSTWHSSMGKDWADSVWWDQATRHGQILKYAARSSVSNWLALDDDVEGWASGDRDKLRATTPERGISNMDTLIELRAKLILARR